MRLKVVMKYFIIWRGAKRHRLLFRWNLPIDVTWVILVLPVFLNQRVGFWHADENSSQLVIFNQSGTFYLAICFSMHSYSSENLFVKVAYMRLLRRQSSLTCFAPMILDPWPVLDLIIGAYCSLSPIAISEQKKFFEQSEHSFRSENYWWIGERPERTENPSSWLNWRERSGNA